MSATMPDEDLLAWLPVASILLSFLASLALLLWICRVRRVIAGKLMARQLWHLAIADILTSIWHMFWFGLPPLWVSFGIGSDQARYLKFDTVCQLGMYANIPFMISVLIEIHIALAAAAVVVRLHGFMHILTRTLPLVWPLGAVLGVIVSGRKHNTWDSAHGRCNADGLSGERLKGIVLLLALVVCVASYVAGASWTAHAAGSVQRRAWRRSHLFVAAAVVTWLPFVLFDFVYQQRHDELVTDQNRLAYYISFGLLLSNGFINAFVYALQSRFVRKAQRRARGIVAPGEPNECAAEFGVAFRPSTDVIDVDPLTAEANYTAERMTSALEVHDDSEVANRQSEESDLLECFECNSSSAV